MSLIARAIAVVLARPAVADWVIRRAMRAPDEHLPGYMERYWLFNRYDRETRVARYPRIGLSVRVHHILRADDAREHHDHPWNARTFILKGGYWEQRDGIEGPFTGAARLPGDTATLKYGEFHRITHMAPGGTWTVFVMGRYRGVWGFLVNGRKIDFKTYLGGKDA
jgi:hypothetical protein